mgnify:CR=1 FL=1
MPKLVFVHGAGESHKVWTYQTNRFTDALAIDLPGHPDGEGENTIEGYAAFVDEFLTQRDLSSVILAGHSMGGAITLRLALKAPSYLKGIVLVATGAKLRVTSLILEGVKADFVNATKLIMNYAFSPEAPNWLKEESLRELQQIRPEVVLGDFEACNKFDTMNDIQRIKIPGLIVCGSEDMLTPVKYSEYLSRNILGSRLVVIQGAGHMVMIEKPDQVNTAIEEFLKDLTRSTETI